MKKIIRNVLLCALLFILGMVTAAILFLRLLKNDYTALGSFKAFLLRKVNELLYGKPWDKDVASWHPTSMSFYNSKYSPQYSQPRTHHAPWDDADLVPDDVEEQNVDEEHEMKFDEIKSYLDDYGCISLSEILDIFGIEWDATNDIDFAVKEMR